MGLSGSHLRIAMVSYGLPVPGLKRGGIERAAHALADGLARRGHDVTVFTHDPRPASAAYDVRPLPWKTFTGTWLGRRMTMGYLGNMLAVVPDYREFDAIVAHGDSLLLPLTGKPVVRILYGARLASAIRAIDRTWAAAAWCLRSGVADRDAVRRRRYHQRERAARQSIRASRDSARCRRAAVRVRSGITHRSPVAPLCRHALRSEARTVPASVSSPRSCDGPIRTRHSRSSATGVRPRQA